MPDGDGLARNRSRAALLLLSIIDVNSTKSNFCEKAVERNLDGPVYGKFVNESLKRNDEK